MDKEDVGHIYNEILLSHEKEQNTATCRDMDGPRDCNTEWSKSDRERQISYDIAYMWNLKKKKKGGTNELTYKTEVVTDVENKLLPGDKWGRGRDKLGDWDWHIHTIIYKIDN